MKTSTEAYNKRFYISHECKTCEGFGELTFNDTNPHGFGPDPQFDVSCSCPDCLGRGYIFKWYDPIIFLKLSRKEFLQLRFDILYRRLKTKLFKKVSLP